MSQPYPYSPTLVLEDGAAAATATRFGRKAGVPVVHDFGASGVEWIGFVVATITALNHNDGDEAYTIGLQLSAAPDFSAPVDTATLAIAAVTAGDPASLLLSNRVGGTVYRYGRLRLTMAGSTPSVTLSAFLAKQLAVEALSFAQLVANGQGQLDSFDAAVGGYQAWATGEAEGGPGGDGRYPLPLAGGPVLLPCPAKLQAVANNAFSQVLNLFNTPAAALPYFDGKVPVVLPNGTNGLVMGVQKIAELKATEATRNHADLWQKFDLQMMGVTARLAAGAAPLFADFTASRQRYRRDGAAITLAQAATGDRTGEAYYPLNVPVTVFASGDRRQTADGLAVERGTANLIPDPTFAGAAIGADDAGGALPTG
ncbi:hypothetical protein, partial [Caulobacter sp. DWP3-1-3b2]|uniref:hypothetical protein n=1 Tax=Caulobacter sp. DWP3-1-3b2 TaxID=2804643 RepID=UPI003CE81EFC